MNPTDTHNIVSNLDRLYADVDRRIQALRPLFNENDLHSGKYAREFDITLAEWRSEVKTTLELLPERRYASKFGNAVPRDEVEKAFPATADDVATFREYYLRVLEEIIIELRSLPNIATTKKAVQPDGDVSVQLIKREKTLLIKTPEGEYVINAAPFTAGRTPDILFDNLLKFNANREVTKTQLETDGIDTERPLKDIVYKSGLTGALRVKFVPVCEEKKILLRDHALIKRAELDKIIRELPSSTE